jgi:hypothetical protein
LTPVYQLPVDKAEEDGESVLLEGRLWLYLPGRNNKCFILCTQNVFVIWLLARYMRLYWMKVLICAQSEQCIASLKNIMK